MRKRAIAVRLLAVVILLGGSSEAAAQVVGSPLARSAAASRVQRYPASARLVDRGAALETVAARAGIKIVYSPEMLAGLSPVEIPPATTTAAEAFRAILSGTELEVRRIDPAHAALVRRPEVPPETARAQANQQEGTINGRVTNASTGESVAGARVTVIDAGLEAVTDENGRYTISLPSGAYQLTVSYIGYADQTRTVTVADGETVSADFQLILDALALEELVVVGYGTREADNLTGAVSTVEAEAFQDRALTTAANALQGQVPGLTVITRSGEPGADAGALNIRGIGTLGDNSPLVLVDGVPGGLDAVSPGDIESITVLKDASSTSIYGVRAANGVILVTTKRGPAAGGGVELSYSGYVGAQAPTRLPPFLGSADYARLYNEALVNEGKTPLYTDEEIAKFANGSDPDRYPDTDWYDALLKDNALQQNHYISLAGGLDATRYRISFQYLDQDGLIPTLSLNRYNLRVNVDTEVNDRLRLSLNLAGTRQLEDGPFSSTSGLFADATEIPPVIPTRYSDGTWAQYKAGKNPLKVANDDGYSHGEETRLTGSAMAEYSLFDGLTLKGRAAVDARSRVRDAFRESFEFYDFESGDVVGVWGTPTRLTNWNDEGQTVTLESFLTYNRTLGSHAVDALLGYSQQTFADDWFEAAREGFPNNFLHELDAGDPTTDQISGSSESWSLQSAFGRVTYSLRDRYLFEANLRYDGSSRFPDGKRYGLFPSFSAGWRLSDEPFLQSLDFINSLKLRGSWGEVGNDEVGLYAYWQTYQLGANYSLGDVLVPGITESRLANQDLTWETATTADIGLDLRVLDGRLGLSVDYFHKATDGILLSLPIPSSVGISAPPQNAASVMNRGWEFRGDYAGRFGALRYQIAGNLSFVHNEITDLAGTGPYIYEQEGLVTIQDIGLPINTFFGYEALGLFQSEEEVRGHAVQDPFTGPGDIKYKDQNGDGVINADDRVHLGSYFPGLTYGATWALGYNGLDLRVFLQGVSRVKGYASQEAAFPFYNNGKVLEWHMGRWTPENTGASFPRLTLTQKHNEHPSSFWVQDASYLRIKNVQLGFTLPSSLMRGLGLSRMRAYVNADNLLTLTGFRGFDPEAPVGTNGGFYPNVTTYTFGLNVSF